MSNHYTVATAGWIVTGFGWLVSYISSVKILSKTEKARKIKEFELSVEQALESYLEYVTNDFDDNNYLKIIMHIDGAVNKLDVINNKLSEKKEIVELYKRVIIFKASDVLEELRIRKNNAEALEKYNGKFNKQQQ
jgi:homoserine acetyltransferase